MWKENNLEMGIDICKKIGTSPRRAFTLFSKLNSLIWIKQTTSKEHTICLCVQKTVVM